MRVSIIAAVARNGVIGRRNQLPWRLPADLRNFKKLTLGHTLLMGRRTFESVGRPLPGRRTIVLSSTQSEGMPGVIQCHSFEAAIEQARESGEDELFVGGGARVFARAFEIAERMYLTRVDGEPDGDTFFPDFADGEWTELSRQEFARDAEHEFPFAICVLERPPGGRMPP